MSLLQAATLVQDAFQVQHEMNARDNVIDAMQAEIDRLTNVVVTLSAKIARDCVRPADLVSLREDLMRC